MGAQLDIIADTALRDDPRLAPPPLRRQPCPPAPVPSASSTVDPLIAAIDKKRAERNIPHDQFAQRAGISIWTWRDLRRGSHGPSPTTLRKLNAALEGQVAPPSPPAVIKSYHRLVMRMLAQAKGLDPDAVAAVDLSTQRPQVPAWLEAARINNMAIYLTTVELQVENADFARALGISREAVRKARNKVEDLRDDPAIDELLTRMRQQVRAG